MQTPSGWPCLAVNESFVWTFCICAESICTLPSETVAQDREQVVAVSDSNHLVPWVPTWHSSPGSSTGFRITKPPTCSRLVTYPNIGKGRWRDCPSTSSGSVHWQRSLVASEERPLAAAACTLRATSIEEQLVRVASLSVG